MRNPQIQFVCPDCGETCIVEVRGEVQVKTSVVGFFINENPTTNAPRYVVEEGEVCGRSDGKVIGYRCDACGFMPMSQARRKPGPDKGMTKPKPIVNKQSLFLWLKRNKMLQQVEVSV